MPQGLSSGTGGTEGWNCCLLLPLLLLLLLEASLLSSIQRCQSEDIYSCLLEDLSSQLLWWFATQRIYLCVFMVLAFLEPIPDRATPTVHLSEA